MCNILIRNSILNPAFGDAYYTKVLQYFDINVLFQHEALSVKMFDHLVSSNNLLGEFEKYGLTEQDRTFIKEQIAGPRKHIQKVQMVSNVITVIHIL